MRRSYARKATLAANAIVQGLAIDKGRTVTVNARITGNPGCGDASLGHGAAATSNLPQASS
jgi:hypothetical protein